MMRAQTPFNSIRRLYYVIPFDTPVHGKQRTVLDAVVPPDIAR